MAVLRERWLLHVYGASRGLPVLVSEPRRPATLDTTVRESRETGDTAESVVELEMRPRPGVDANAAFVSPDGRRWSVQTVQRLQRGRLLRVVVTSYRRLSRRLLPGLPLDQAPADFLPPIGWGLRDSQTGASVRVLFILNVTNDGQYFSCSNAGFVGSLSPSEEFPCWVVGPSGRLFAGNLHNARHRGLTVGVSDVTIPRGTPVSSDRTPAGLRVADPTDGDFWYAVEPGFAILLFANLPTSPTATTPSTSPGAVITPAPEQRPASLPAPAAIAGDVVMPVGWPLRDANGPMRVFRVTGVTSTRRIARTDSGVRIWFLYRFQLLFDSRPAAATLLLSGANPQWMQGRFGSLSWYQPLLGSFVDPATGATRATVWATVVGGGERGAIIPLEEREPFYRTNQPIFIDTDGITRLFRVNWTAAISTCTP